MSVNLLNYLGLNAEPSNGNMDLPRGTTDGAPLHIWKSNDPLDNAQSWGWMLISQIVAGRLCIEEAICFCEKLRLLRSRRCSAFTF